jgi:hypothetical protein
MGKHMPGDKSDKSYDFRAALIDLMISVNSLKGDFVDGKFLYSRMLDRLDYMTIVIHDMIERATPTEKPPPFYPEQGTVFIDSVMKPKNPCIVENKSLLSTSGEGWVCFYDREEGMGDYPRWLSDVFADNIKILWCPSMGVVYSNEDYLMHWGLRATPTEK